MTFFVFVFASFIYKIRNREDNIMLKKLSKPLNLLIVCLAVILVASLSASLVQNSFFSVKVDAISFETDNGELAGLLYTPRGVDADNPAPTVITTHGYLNNKEMQEIAAIELSKRGYVVLAFDMYDHGDSQWDTPAQFSFYVQAVYDAVQYMYDQDYVLKDADGNGMIGVSGHSMGGFSATSAVILDEMDFATSGIRKIATMLSVGSDFRYIPFPDPISYIGPRSAGMVAAHYDQFFFDNVTPGSEGSVRYKDFVTDPVGIAFLGLPAGTEAFPDTYFSVAGGQRVIFTPDETHPQNTWSLETGEDTVKFFEKAFTFQLMKADMDDLEDYGVTTGTTGQTWWLKEAFTLIALLALITMIFPLFSLITTLPVFNKAIGEANSNESFATRAKEKNIVKSVVIIGATLLSAYYIKVFMDRSAEELEKLATFTIVVIVLAVVVAAVAWILKVLGKVDQAFAIKVSFSAGFLLLSQIYYRWLLTNTDIFETGVDWGAPSVNTIVYWALASAGLILMITVATSIYFNQGEEVKNPYGLNTTPVQLGASLLTAIVMVIGVLFVVAIVGWVFLTDFRFYTYAIQIFNWNQLKEGIRYIPAFSIFYFAAAVSVFVNTRSIKRAWLGDLFSAFLLAGPIVLLLVVNYWHLYNQGVAIYPTFSLSIILTVGLVPTLSFAGIIMRRLSLKTGNIWTSVFFTAIFFTIITLSNTIIYQLAG
jgi:pimeloyl-ACP methyl ester carboxylesterase